MSEYRKYAELDELEHHGKHVSAMTGEDLHSKSDIAAELAWRDELLDTAVEALENIRISTRVQEIDFIASEALNAINGDNNK